jgi:caffeoyl-CoA O-methyltransferase
MTPKSDFLAAPLLDYVLAHSSTPDDLLGELAAETARLGGISAMQIAPEQGAFMGMLARLIRPSFAVEVGTFTGYSAICVARELPPGGRLLCCDVSEEWTGVARRYWERAKLSDRIDLVLAPALTTLRALAPEPTIDWAFIDADKSSYLDYWEEIVPRLSPGGVLLVDNTLWSGKVLDPGVEDRDTVALRAFNDHVAADARMDKVLLPLADGLTMAVRARS